MAVTFLVVSRHEGTQVDQITQQANAKLAAESAFEQAKIQILAPDAWQRQRLPRQPARLHKPGLPIFTTAART